MQRDDASLIDLLKAANTAQQFKNTANKAVFLKDELLQSGILHQLIIMGEAVKPLSDGFRKVHPEIPWKLIAGMRESAEALTWSKCAAPWGELPPPLR